MVTAGIALFEYDPVNPLGTITLNPLITPDQLALVGGEFDGGGTWVAAGGSGDNTNIANVVASIADNGSGFTSLVGELGISSQQNLNSILTSTTLNDSAIQATR